MTPEEQIGKLLDSGEGYNSIDLDGQEEPNLLDEEIAFQEVENEPQLTAPLARQLKLSRKERERLWWVINQGYQDALVDHRARQSKFARYYEAMRRRVGMSGGEAGRSNFSVPLTKWQVYTKWAKTLDGLFGDDAEITASPTAPSDAENAEAIGRYMSWRVLSAMQAIEPLSIFVFRQIVNGRAHAFVPYIRQEYDTPDGVECDYEGPKLYPLCPDDFIVPGEDAQCVDDFSWVLRRYWTTPDEVVRMAGVLYFDEWAKPEGFQKLYKAAQDKKRRDEQIDETKREMDRAEGVERNDSLSAGESLEVWEWYGKYRLPKGKAGDGGNFDDFRKRNRQRTEIVVRVFPALGNEGIGGAQSLVEMYPKMRKRRPFVEAAVVKDGSYWSPGLPELLEDIEQELTVSENLLIDAGEIAVGPLIFMKPHAAANMEATRYEPKMMIPVDDPQRDVNVVNVNPNMNYVLAHQQNLIGFAERVTGINDMNSGRQSDRPNAPRTARQTVALLDEGNIRVNLDLTTLRDDLSKMLRYIWDLDTQYAPPEVFYRVTDRRAKGLFDKNKFGKMTAKERGGRYDFDIKFATSSHSREARKQALLEMTQIFMTIPLFAQNPNAQWKWINKLCESYGIYNFAEMVQKPPDLPLPMAPEDEWPKILQGDEVHVHPGDNHQVHMDLHTKAIADEMEASPKDRDLAAIRQMMYHIQEHQVGLVQQQKQQQVMAGLNALGSVLGTVIGTAQGGQGGQLNAGENAGGNGGDLGLAQLLGAGQGQPGSLSLPNEAMLDAGGY